MPEVRNRLAPPLDLPYRLVNGFIETSGRSALQKICN